MELSDQIRDVVKHKGSWVASISPDALIYTALELMAAKNIGALLVVATGEPVGIISERDYARKLVLRGKSSKETCVREVMSSPVETVTPEHRVSECMAIMTERRLRHLPVMEGRQLVGIVSIGDLVNWIISAQATTIRQLEHYITGRYPA
jgi:CBS domain-containing protein